MNHLNVIIFIQKHIRSHFAKKRLKELQKENELKEKNKQIKYLEKLMKGG